LYASCRHPADVERPTVTFESRFQTQPGANGGGATPRHYDPFQVQAAASGPSSERGCLFCLTADGGFSSVEHPIPESLGNTELILPKGVVCDRCNNGRLAVLDQALADLMPLKMRRTTLGIENKRGNVPITVFQDARLERVEGRAALTGPAPRSWRLEHVDPDDPRWSIGTATLQGGRPLRDRYAAQISRALLKVGFGAAWPELRQRLMDDDFDELRALILGKRNQRGYVFMVNHLDETHGGHHIHYTTVKDLSDGRADIYVAAKMLGVYLATDSFRSAPPPTLTPELGYTASF
jgi:hypothetical protein